MLELYYSPGACATAAHIVANEAGVPVDPIKVDLKSHRTADGRDFHEINPRGYVPALRLDCLLYTSDAADDVIYG